MIYYFFLFYFVLTNVANSAPILAAISAIATTLASGGILGTLLQGLLLTAVQFGISVIRRAMQKKNNQNQRPAGINAQIQVGGTIPLSFLVGKTATAGKLEYVNTWGVANNSPNAYLTMVISLADLPISALGSTIWVNGEKCTLSATNDAANPTFGKTITQFLKDATNHAWIKFYDGTQTVADPFLISKFGTDPDRPYDASMVGRDIPYVVATFLLNRELFPGIPQLRFECNGMKLYNPAKDSTNGGVGAHRWTNPATWEFTENNAVIIYNITRGIMRNNVWFYGGKNYPATVLPSASFIAAHNECNVAIPLLAGGTEPQFRAGFEISVDVEPLETIENFLNGCNGRMSEIGGFFKLKVGAPSAPVYSFTDGDLVATEDLEFDPFPSITQTFNGATARYPEPLQAWEMKDAPVYTVAAYELQDENQRLLAPLVFETTPYPVQVQRLMKAAVEANRRFRRHVIVLPPDAWLIEPGIDTIEWTSTREGYTNKQFIPVAITGKQGMNQVLQIVEVEPLDYSWTPASDEKPVAVGYVGTVRPGEVPTVGWSVLPHTLFDTSTLARRPTIAVTYKGDMRDIRHVRIFVRLASTDAVVSDTLIEYGSPLEGPSKTTILAAGPYLPNTAYEVRGEFRSISGQIFTPSTWLTVTTPNVLISNPDIGPGAITNINVLDGAITGPKIANAAITALLIADDAIGATKIIDGAVTSGKIAIGSITETKIADNAISSPKMQANSITARELFITDFTNLNQDPYFENQSVWTVGAGATFGTVAGAGYPSGDTYLDKTGANSNVIGAFFNVSPNNEYLFTFVAKRVNATAGTLRAYLQFFEGDGTFISVVGSLSFTTADATTYVVKTANVTPPSNARKVRIVIDNAATTITGVYRAGSVAVTLRANGQLIVDGSITGDKVVANTLTGDKFIANTITTKELLITDFTNLHGDPYFTDSRAWFSVGAGATFGTTAGGGYPATDTYLDKTGANSNVIGTSFDATEGNEYRLTFVARRVNATAGTLRAYLQFLNASGGNVGQTALITFTTTDATTYVVKTANAIAPANTKTARVVIDNVATTIVGVYRAGMIAVQSRASAELIVDGAITTAKLAANSVTASKILAGSITADKLNVTTLSAIVANLGTITAGIIQNATGKWVINATAGSIEWFD